MQVVNTIIHEDWDSEAGLASYSNIALLHLGKEVYHAVPAINVKNTMFASGQQVVALRWDEYDSTHTKHNFGHLIVDTEAFLQSSACNQTALWNGSIEEGLVCGVNPHRKSSCIGENDFIGG